MSQQQQWDVVILGGGAAGLSAALFSCRRGLNTLLITKEVGGQTASTLEIENYPGMGRIEGSDLTKTMRDQATQFGGHFIYGDIEKVSKDDGLFFVEVSGNHYIGKTLIVACGKRPRSLGVPNEHVWLGKQLFYSSTDIPKDFVKGKRVAVIGGGSAALEEAILHGRTADTVYVIHRRGNFRAEDVLIQRAKDMPNIQYVFHAEIEAVHGIEEIQSLSYIQDSTQHILPIDVVCVKIGYETDATLFESLIPLDNQGRIPIDRNAHTSVEGLFAAGDITNVDFQQIVISAGDGAKAALSAFFYLMEQKGMKGTKTDWGYLD